MAIDLPEGALTPGPEYWYWLGGRPALDLVNTLRERWRRSVDCLTSDADVVEWLVRAELLEAPAATTGGILAQARDLREAIDVAGVAVVAGEAPDASALAHIDGWLPHAAAPPRLHPGPGGLPVLDERPPAGDARHALGLVALDAARMLGTPAERARVRICASGTCSARFYDRSPAARRRWCSMAQCGNVAKARRHRARKDSA
jgi:predicted RNA-binding Zn ribbon-like protein